MDLGSLLRRPELKQDPIQTGLRSKEHKSETNERTQNEREAEEPEEQMRNVTQ